MDNFGDNFKDNFSTYLVRTQCLFGVRGLFPYPLKWAKELVQSIAAFPLSFRYASNVGHQELAKRYPKLLEFQPFVNLKCKVIQVMLG